MYIYPLCLEPPLTLLSTLFYLGSFTFNWRITTLYCVGVCHISILISLCCRSVAQLCPTLCDSMNFGTPDFSVLHYLPEFAHTHFCRVGDDNQGSHLLPALLLLPSILSSIRVFPNESALCSRWPKQ